MSRRRILIGKASRSALMTTAVLLCMFIVLFQYSSSWGQCYYIPGDFNNNGVVGLSDLTYFVNFFKGGAPPPYMCPCPSDPFYAACDVTGDCMVNGADATRFVRYIKGIVGNLSYCSSCPPAILGANDNPKRMALDVGAEDSIIVGNLDRSPISAAPGDTVNIPVWVRNDELVSSLSISLATDNQHVVERLGGQLMAPLTSWDDCSFFAPALDIPSPGFTSQSITGWYDLGGAPNPALNTNGIYTQIGEFSLVISSDPSNIGDTAQLMIGTQPRIGQPVFSDSAGTSEWNIVPLFSIMTVISGGCHYVPGDANNDGIYNGIDVGYSVNYLKQIGPPPTLICNCPPWPAPTYAAADANGNCSFNGIDVSYSVNYLKQIGPPPVGCADCPPSAK
jgi:hypothetical protein